ncbi:uncharacterized protein FOMMEDRAFT_26819 [Fomitiporia mediterranea MF3/22]|uniref:uncharacterized protein n=1 Tax=Fomitiporia mediterranea (strain MF3/22) TaxID=694068 RepID=UPI0004408B02|nr:uncharacterized protein FOMMEDRAFT_26819 [Fomitiporia mediterranea MF3/22]EJD06051.1 hypothetical protein FOMMEDRAFT_26819 [Fomitiporia mediterranea MF3/22]
MPNSKSSKCSNASSCSAKSEYNETRSGALKAIVNPYIKVKLQNEIDSLYQSCKTAQEEKQKEGEITEGTCRPGESKDNTDKNTTPGLERKYKDQDNQSGKQKIIVKRTVEDLILDLNVLISTIERQLDIDPNQQGYIDEHLKENNNKLKVFLVQIRDTLDTSTTYKEKMPVILDAACKALETITSSGKDDKRQKVEEIYNKILALDNQMPPIDDTEEAAQNLQLGKKKMEEYKSRAEALQVEESVHDKREEALEEFKNATGEAKS